MATGGVEWSGVEWSFFFFFYVQGLGSWVKRPGMFFFPMAGKRTRLFNLKMDIDR